MLDTTSPAWRGISKKRGHERQVKSAMIYPQTLFSFVVVVVFLFDFCHSCLCPDFQDFGGTLPWPLNSSLPQQCDEELYSLRYPCSSSLRFRIQSSTSNRVRKAGGAPYMLRIPILGPLLQKAAIARFARTLSTLLVAACQSSIARHHGTDCRQ